MQFASFYTANWLYIIFFIFLIFIQLFFNSNVSVTKMLQFLGAFTLVPVGDSGDFRPDKNSLPQQKKFANFNEFSEIKKIRKIRTKIR